MGCLNMGLLLQFLKWNYCRIYRHWVGFRSVFYEKQLFLEEETEHDDPFGAQSLITATILRNSLVQFSPVIVSSCRISWWKHSSCSRTSLGRTCIPSTGWSWTWCRTSEYRGEKLRGSPRPAAPAPLRHHGVAWKQRPRGCSQPALASPPSLMQRMIEKLALEELFGGLV